MNQLIEDLVDVYIFKPISVWSICVFFVALLFHVLTLITKPKGSRPTIFYKESAFSRYLFEKIPRLQQPYCPPFWARNPNVQTIVATYLLPRKEVRFERQFLQLKDRGVVALDWATSDCCHTLSATMVLKKPNPVLIILPDLLADAMCISNFCEEATRRGFRSVVFNRRGDGDSPLTTPRLQPYGDPGDLRQVIKFLRCRLPQAKLTALGYGSGADLLFAYLGEFGSSAFLSACIVISPLYDPESLYESGFPPIYSFLRLISFRKFLSRHSSALQKLMDVNAAMKCKSLQDFERHVFWKMCNSDSTEQYWEKNAPLRDADEMSVPLLCITSRDDPLVPEEVIPYDMFQVYPHLFLAITEHGGHGGFIQSDSRAVLSWAENIALDFLKTALDFSESDDVHKNKYSQGDSNHL